MPEIEIALDGVVSLLQKLKPFKACGPDQILNRILKEVAEEITPASMATSTVPVLSGNQNYVMCGSMPMSHQFSRRVTILLLVNIDRSR